MKIPASRKRDSRGGGGGASSSSSSSADSSLVPLKQRRPAEYLLGRPDVRELVRGRKQKKLPKEEVSHSDDLSLCVFLSRQVRRLSGPELGAADARVEEAPGAGAVSIHLVS